MNNIDRILWNYEVENIMRITRPTEPVPAEQMWAHIMITLGGLLEDRRSRVLNDDQRKRLEQLRLEAEVAYRLYQENR